MSDQLVDVPDDFVGLVRDALMHLYDPVHLQTHPLLLGLKVRYRSEKTRGTLLRQTLLDAIEALRPPSTASIDSRSWRTYRILELRYLEGEDIETIANHFAISRSQYHREHQRALQAVASILWERWQFDQIWRTVTTVQRNPEREVIRCELDTLQTANITTWIDIDAVIQDVIALLQPLSTQHGVELRFAAVGTLPIVPGDRVVLRHALLTILSHCISNGLNRSITLGSVAIDSELQIQITGVAIGPLSTDRFGIEESLPFVEAVNGRITNYVEEQSGLWQICLTLPIRRAPVVLVVDNNVDFIRLTRRYLAGTDWQVVGVTDVEDAYKVAREQRPRVILLDIVIPGRDGWDLLIELKKSPDTQHIPVIVCSVIDEPEVARSLGAVSYLPKPIDQYQLSRALEAFL
jgi:CheY-like chemotaxis protein